MNEERTGAVGKQPEAWHTRADLMHETKIGTSKAESKWRETGRWQAFVTLADGTTSRMSSAVQSRKCFASSTGAR